MPDYLIEPCDPTHPDAIPLLAALSETLAALTGSSGRQSFDNDDVRAEGATFLLARNGDGAAVGCVACRPLRPGIAEIKRLFALPDNPGAGSQLLSAAERFAREFGYQQAWLETRRTNSRAVEFYLRRGYQIIDNYGRYVGQEDAVCFARDLQDAARHAERA
ncbi:GNAT family N-acetyltransferase [Cronobacter dublinensis subsp. dublinensis]|nr:GNAT family N-acetyltransferase [Cronobacter dublinensis subsp. dublinensis]EGT5663078.1 GNAT family N-acetyltransferase [Cronobacter dublinensis subsp. dublinensis]EGT5670675.1 GNAT family N-acetyltransferase [Cronobacter dublinensis subsp. dublinensis]EGT5671407.1 GNAT family N-acetyltransferase [Cronobacter dublinensis subsp. dublinensis]EGT5674733.1 GNAT family N-acetyltransferase [Cronobacter dublinensis subsp. dublinensis]